MISICTTIKNRLHHLRQTLPVNLLQNRGNDVEFLILDYNSQDGLQQYLQETYAAEISSGSMVYYCYKDADQFHRSHARNLAFKLARGTIVCNVDADNYAGPGFAARVASQLQTGSDFFITGVDNPYNIGDAMGKLCVRKTDFLAVSGYDENFEGHGFEDYDLMFRLQLSGLRTQVLQQKEFLQAIKHSDEERIAQEKTCIHLQALYVRYIDPDTSEILLLMKDGTCVSGEVINRPQYVKNEAQEQAPFPPYRISMEQEWQQGYWQQTENRLALQFGPAEQVYVRESACGQEWYRNRDRIFYSVSRPEMITEGIIFYTQMKNRQRMIANYRSRNLQPNRSFGAGTVYKNFDDHAPIQVC